MNTSILLFFHFFLETAVRAAVGMQMNGAAVGNTAIIHIQVLAMFIVCYCKKMVRHVNCTRRMPWIAIDGGS